jgi:hypothetical protein
MATTPCRAGEHTGETLFCTTCGKTKEPDALKSVRIVNFHGRFSTSPAMEAFKATGDPSVFEKSPR